MTRIDKDSPAYRGRFAPTPSGPLHAGSLLAALASWLDARTAAGSWLLRIDDLDAARCQDRHVGTIQRQLDAHGLYWDGVPCMQSGQRRYYRQAFRQLQENDCLYPCNCTRAIRRQTARQGPDGEVYDGHCRTNPPTAAPVRCAMRLCLKTQRIGFYDQLQGYMQRDAETEIGDFIVKRADRLPGYQLACAVDDARMHITHVVRGADLIGSTFRQIAVQQALGLNTPAYAHIPVLQDRHGRKLSKQNHARPLDPANAARNLWKALQQLGQQPPEILKGEAPAQLLEWALLHWRLARVPVSSGCATRIIPI